MAGQRQAKLIDLEFAPGYMTTRPPRSAKNRWKDGNRVRFHNGFPEKIGGWIRQELEGWRNGEYAGIARAVHDWSSLDSQQWIAIGTHSKLFLIGRGTLYDITPLRYTSVRLNPLTTVSGSAIVTIHDPMHRAETGDWVHLSNASTVGGLDLSGPFEVTVSDPDSYTITAATPASATATGGGNVMLEYDINSGLPKNGNLVGYGTGTYGDPPEYGTPRNVADGLPSKMRIWSLQNYGEDLVATYNGGELYWWDRTNGPESRARLVDEAPKNIQWMLVNQSNQSVILFGCNNLIGTPDSMRIRWCSEGNIKLWSPDDESETNSAGGNRLDYGSRLITATKSRGQILVFSDTQSYAMNYVSSADGYSFSPLGTMAIVGQNAGVDVNGIWFGMGYDDFYIYDGTLRALPCDVWNRVFDDFSRTQAEMAFACSYRAKNEIWWFYPKVNESIAYVVYNYADRCWYYGDMTRTAFHDASEALTGSITNPYGLNLGRLYKHEYGTDEVEGQTTTPMSWFCETWDLTSQSDSHFLVNELIPDFVRLSVGMRASLKAKGFPRESSYAVSGPYPIDPSTNSIYTRARGSQMALRLDPAVGTQETPEIVPGQSWRLGTWQMLASPYGGR